MLKMCFLKTKELEGVLNKGLSNKKGVSTLCNIVVNEDISDEYVKIVHNDIVENLYLEDLFEVLEHELKIKIINYDVIEVGDYGDGFVFFLK